MKIQYDFAAMFGAAMAYRMIAEEMTRRLMATSAEIDMSEIRRRVEQKFKSLPFEGLPYEKDHLATKSGLEAIVDYFDAPLSLGDR